MLASLFVYKSMWQYLLFGVLSVIATLIFLFVHFKKKRTSVCVTWVDICVAMWCFWLLLCLCFFPCEHYHLVYLLTSGLLFFAMRGLLYYERSRRLFRPLLELMVVYVVVVCILQLLNVINSGNKLFHVTGPHENPNVTAMFLALCLPLLLFDKRERNPSLSSGCSAFLFFSKKKKNVCFKLATFVGWTAILGGIMCIMLLRCRTAWVGMAMTLLVYLWNQKKVRAQFFFFSRKKKALLAFFASIVVVFSGTGMYRMKKASADGRLFIWKVATSQLKDTPWNGRGYGLFEVFYNKYQKEYLATHFVSQNESVNARYVFMPYSEWLENALSGGIPGGVLFVLLLTVPLCQAVKKKDFLYICAFSNVVWFASVNYLTRAIPVWTLFILYMAAWSNTVCYVEWRSKWLRYVCRMTILAWMCMSTSSYVKKGVAQYQLKQSIDIFAYQPQRALDVMLKYYGWASTSECYLRYYGQMLLAHGHYAEAEKVLSRALCFTYNTRTLAELENAHLLKKQNKDEGED